MRWFRRHPKHVHDFRVIHTPALIDSAAGGAHAWLPTVFACECGATETKSIRWEVA